MELIFASNNKHKVEEVRSLINGVHNIISLKDLGITEEIPETASTLEGNALIKARYVYRLTGKNCFSDDTGLEVEAINNEPGVLSARYAGEGKDMHANRAKLLSKMEGITHRNARFRTVVALIYEGKEYLFEGSVTGIITESERGNDGFGYDPIFQPTGFNKTFAELDLNTKNQISHRGQAFAKLLQFLSQNSKA
ncbi:MAG: RdgB/HAM1 family non-canonical purine NTP pyrophosphatase [Microbacter sp.]